MKNEKKSMRSRPNLIGWFVASCFVSVACLPQTSGILGIAQNVVQVGLSIDGNSNLQNMVVATAPNSVVRICDTGTAARSCIVSQGTVPVVHKGDSSSVSVHAVENAQALGALLQKKSVELVVGKTANGQIDANSLKKFTVEVSATNPGKIAATPVVVPVTQQPSTQTPPPSPTRPTGTATPSNASVPSDQLANTLINGQVTIPVVDFTAGTPTIAQMNTVSEADFRRDYNRKGFATNDHEKSCSDLNGRLIWNTTGSIECI